MSDRGPKALAVVAREEESYCVLPGDADRGLVLLCDHASNAMPAEYGTLGLPEDQLRRHIAYDIGVAPIVRALSSALGAPAVMTRYSRLLIDPNRGRDDPTLIMRLSDGAVIPGNKRLDAAERERRARRFYDPYHAAISAVIDQCLAAGSPPALLSLHSFTESWKEFTRPWHVGVLWSEDARLARPLLDEFYADADLIVGDNEPYSGHLEGDCLWQHGRERGLPNAIVEVRQDLIRDEAGQEAWAQRLQRIVERIAASPARSQPAAPDSRNAGTARPAGQVRDTRVEKGL